MQSFRMTHWLFVLSWLPLISHCSDPQVNAPHLSDQTFASVDNLFLADSRLDANDLKASQVSTANHNLSGYQALALEVKADPQADFVQYAICSNSLPRHCAPSPDKPSEYSGGLMLIGNTVPGSIEVLTRPCLRAEHALDPAAACGPWQSSKFFQLTNASSEGTKVLEAILEKQRGQEKAVREKCDAIYDELVRYQSEQGHGAGVQNEFAQMLGNIVVMGRDIACSLLTSRQMQVIETNIRESERAKAPGQALGLRLGPGEALEAGSDEVKKLSEPEIGGLAIMALGGTGVVAGMVAGLKATRNSLSVVENQSQALDEGRVANVQVEKKFRSRAQLRAELDATVGEINAYMDEKFAKLKAENPSGFADQKHSLIKSAWDQYGQRLDALQEVKTTGFTKARVVAALGVATVVVGLLYYEGVIGLAAQGPQEQHQPSAAGKHLLSVIGQHYLELKTMQSERGKLRSQVLDFSLAEPRS